jgi:H+/gluconate symporter-like permease
MTSTLQNLHVSNDVTKVLLANAFCELQPDKNYSFQPLLVAICAAAALNVATLTISPQLGPISMAKRGRQITRQAVVI